MRVRRPRLRLWGSCVDSAQCPPRVVRAADRPGGQRGLSGSANDGGLMSRSGAGMARDMFSFSAAVDMEEEPRAGGIELGLGMMQLQEDFFNFGLPDGSTPISLSWHSFFYGN